MNRSLSDNSKDHHLFDAYPPGEYSYNMTSNTKSVVGSLKLADNPVRDSKAQMAAGGENRRAQDNPWGPDEGGHIIAARFGGLSIEENLFPQNRNFNRSEYKRMENSWAKHLEQGDKVFVCLDFCGEGRPEAVVGYAIIETSSGKRYEEYYSLYNESRMEQDSWAREEAEFMASEEGQKWLEQEHEGPVPEYEEQPDAEVETEEDFQPQQEEQPDAEVETEEDFQPQQEEQPDAEVEAEEDFQPQQEEMPNVEEKAEEDFRPQQEEFDSAEEGTSFENSNVGGMDTDSSESRDDGLTY